MTKIGLGHLLLARAVKRGELESIRRLNRFTNLAGLEVKYFCTSADGARAFAQLAQASFADGPYTIVMTAIDPRVLPSTSRLTVDGGIQAVTVPTRLLYALRAPTIVEGE